MVIAQKPIMNSDLPLHISISVKRKGYWQAETNYLPQYSTGRITSCRPFICADPPEKPENIGWVSQEALNALNSFSFWVSG